MPIAIEWNNSSPDDIIWKYPDDRISLKSELIVMENQLAIIYRDGMALDTFGPGRYKLNKKTLPITAQILRKIKGNEIPVSCVFISRSQFQGKFGGRTQTSELAPLMFHGEFWFRVKEPRIFVNDVVGNQKIFKTIKVNSYMRSFINERMIDELSHYDLQTVFTKLDETSLTVKTRIRMAFERIGAELVDLKFSGMDTTDKYRDRLFWLKTGKVDGSEIVKMETVTNVADSIGSGGNRCINCGVNVGNQQFCHSCGNRLTN